MIIPSGQAAVSSSSPSTGVSLDGGVTFGLTLAGGVMFGGGATGGVVLTGGGAFLNGARDLGQKIFNVPCVLGKPHDVQGLSTAKEGPLYACQVGAIRYAASLRKVVEKPSIGQRMMKALWGGAHE